MTILERNPAVLATRPDGDGGLFVTVRLPADPARALRMAAAAVAPSATYVAKAYELGPWEAILSIRPRHRGNPVEDQTTVDVTARLERVLGSILRMDARRDALEPIQVS